MNMLDDVTIVRIAAIAANALNNFGRGKDSSSFVRQAKVIEDYINTGKVPR